MRISPLRKLTKPNSRYREDGRDVAISRETCKILNIKQLMFIVIPRMPGCFPGSRGAACCTRLEMMKQTESRESIPLKDYFHTESWRSKQRPYYCSDNRHAILGMAWKINHLILRILQVALKFKKENFRDCFAEKRLAMTMLVNLLQSKCHTVKFYSVIHPGDSVPGPLGFTAFNQWMWPKKGKAGNPAHPLDLKGARVASQRCPIFLPGSTSLAVAHGKQKMTFLLC